MKEANEYRDTYELKQSELPSRLDEAEGRISAHAKQSKSQEAIKQARRVLEFTGSVDRYAERVLPVDDAGNRPPRPPRRPRESSMSQRHDSSLTSQSTTTTRTQSTQPSYQEAPVAESPPTSPEPTHVDTPSKPQVDKEEVLSMYNFCERCGGTCTKTEAHNNSVRYVPSAPGSLISLVIPPLVPRSPSKPEANSRRGRASSSPQSSKTRLSSQGPMSPKIARYEIDRSCLAKTSLDVTQDAGTRHDMDLVINENDEDEDDLQDEYPQMEEPRNERPRTAGPSIWQATGAFEGDMPRGLRTRRQRSQSP